MQGITNSAWAFSVRSFLSQPLLNSLSAAASANIRDYGTVELASMSWSVALLGLWHHGPLSDALAAAALRLLRACDSGPTAKLIDATGRSKHDFSQNKMHYSEL
eukprot:gnl/MRDRNA2_/MRDRNA2_81313_c0_seq2.p2 gnl/MRDRNA2_/MRDRNA2_81313_c0~~gnl/MRDRNA2_/MRDRNA2_81313_c0_seq2.p2  ORF type:complete len:104 (+),score=6.92 gnl/MRDRNA2_/MRDRNA2_81313_c0_seq2:457-768(+)